MRGRGGWGCGSPVCASDAAAPPGPVLPVLLGCRCASPCGCRDARWLFNAARCCARTQQKRAALQPRRCRVPPAARATPARPACQPHWSARPARNPLPRPHPSRNPLPCPLPSPCCCACCCAQVRVGAFREGAAPGVARQRAAPRQRLARDCIPHAPGACCCGDEGCAGRRPLLRCCCAPALPLRWPDETRRLPAPACRWRCSAACRAGCVWVRSGTCLEQGGAGFPRWPDSSRQHPQGAASPRLPQWPLQPSLKPPAAPPLPLVRPPPPRSPGCTAPLTSSSSPHQPTLDARRRRTSEAPSGTPSAGCARARQRARGPTNEDCLSVTPPSA